MITKLKTITHSNSDFYPYFNLALEKFLLDTVDEETVILYLWQNEKAILFGVNQNIQQAIWVDKLLESGGFPLRHLSEGGAIYEDLGSLNFTFLTKTINYNVEKQFQVLIEACRLLGLSVQKKGEDTLTIENQPFSISHFYRSPDGLRSYHQGVIQIHTDLSQIPKYVKTQEFSPESQQASFEKAPTVNLIDFCPNLTIEAMCKQLTEAFQSIYGLESTPINPESVDPRILYSYVKIFMDEEWVLGEK